MRAYLVSIFCICLNAYGFWPLKTLAAEPDIFSHLKASHPRLIIDEKSILEFNNSLLQDQQKNIEYKALFSKCQNLLNQPVATYSKNDMLMVSRRVMRRVQNLSFLYLVTKDKRFFSRARAELLNAAAFPDWNPRHFLDTAEMTNGLALGYDWLYNDLSDVDRKIISAAIIKKGLLPLKDAYDHNRYFWVQDNATNWNQVCNGSAIMACLSLGLSSDQPENNKLLQEIAQQAISHFRSGMKNYGPDGGWDEGPGYWHYATNYAVRTRAALQSATGSDCSFSDQPGFSQTGDFALALIGPSGTTFNFADATGTIDTYPEFFWLAKRFNKPYLAWRERDQLTKDRTNINALDLIWYSNNGKSDDLDQLPTAVCYGGTAQVASLRSSYSELHSAFVAVKGGNNASHHAHLDLGTFVYEFDGTRWVEQLGLDDYSLPGYFDTKGGANSPRWKYYRLNSFGQNVVLVNNANQDVKATSTIVDSQLAKDKAINFAILDLSQANKSNKVTTMHRGVALVTSENRMMLQDEIKATEPISCQWQIHTRAQVEISKDGRQAILRRGNQLTATILSPENAKFSTEEIAIEPPQATTAGIRLLKIKLDSSRNQRIAVLFSPFVEPAARKDRLPKIVPLADWGKNLEKTIKGDSL